MGFDKICNPMVFPVHVPGNWAGPLNIPLYAFEIVIIG